MKKFINAFLISLAFLAVFLTHSIVRAQQTAELAQEQATKSVDYLLPYPGILPDNPLYNLKMIRDRVLSWFIFDPVKRAEYFLLMADKRINAGKMLIDYGKTSLGESTINKGQAYLVKATEEVKKAKAAGRDITSLIDKLDKATSKHLEVLQGVLEKAPESAKKGLQNAILNSQKGHDNVLKVMEKKKEKIEEKEEGKEEKEGEGEVTPTETEEKEEEVKPTKKPDKGKGKE